MWKRDEEEGKPDPSESNSHSTSIPRKSSQSQKTSQKVLFLTSDPLNWWSGLESIARVQMDGEDRLTLLDSGSTINVVTPEFVDVCSLDVGPLSNLYDGTLGIHGFGRVFSWALGLHNHKGSGGGSLGLWQRSSSPSHTRLYLIWVPSTSYFGYTHHESDHQHDQGK